MPSLLHRLFTTVEEEPAPPGPAESSKETSSAEEAHGSAEPVRRNTNGRLISSTELPSAAEELNQLFCSEESDPSDSSSPVEGQPLDICLDSPPDVLSAGQSAAATDAPVQKPSTTGAEDSILKSSTAESSGAETKSDESPADENSIQPLEPKEPENDVHFPALLSGLEDSGRLEDQPCSELAAAEASEDQQPTASAQDVSLIDAPDAPVVQEQAFPRDWALEEKLASHSEWLDSQGTAGRRADLANANLEGSELIGVHLRFADLHDANLRAADLLLADLRDACLMRADLEDSCLVGANLEAANLEGASLETAMGLVAQQVAGANLRDALLPPHIMEFPAASKFEQASRAAWRCLVALYSVGFLSWLILWKATDAQLVADSAIIPYFHSHAAAAALPTAKIFLLAPLVLFVLYLALQFQVQRLLNSVAELPAVFPDGHSVEGTGRAVVTGLLRAHFRWFDSEGLSTHSVEKAISVLAAYWMAPITLALFWARYLTTQDFRGTFLQMLFLVIAAGIALHVTTKTGRPAERWTVRRRWTHAALACLRKRSATKISIYLGAVLLLLSAGTIAGIPHDPSRAPQYSHASIRRWAPDFFWMFGFDPYADLTEASLSRKPANWNGSEAQVPLVDGLHRTNVKLRYARAYGVFLANAHLWHADFQGAFLSDADLRKTDLGESNLRYANLDDARVSYANLNRARLDNASLARADLRESNLSYASLTNASLVDARLNHATLYKANLASAMLSRANLETADLRGSDLVAARLDHADLRQAYLWSAKLLNADLHGANLQNAILIGADLRGANLQGAHLSGAVLNDANLSGTNLDGADLRGALGLTAAQICSAATKGGVLLDSPMGMQVDALCGLAQ